MDGYYEPYREQLDLFVREGMLDTKSRELISFPRNIDELKELL